MNGFPPVERTLSMAFCLLTNILISSTQIFVDFTCWVKLLVSDVYFVLKCHEFILVSRLISRERCCVSVFLLSITYALMTQ